MSKKFKNLFFRNKLPYLIVLTLTLFITCNKDEQLVQTEFNSSNEILDQIEIAEKNEALTLIAKSLAKVVESENARRIIKTEAMRKVDGDYDVLYRFIAKQPLKRNALKSDDIENQDTDLSCIEELIASNLEKNDSLTIENLSELVNKFDNLEISVPRKCNKWDATEYIPLVAIRPVDYDDQATTHIKAYNSKGEKVLLDAKIEPEYPVIVIGESERVDKEGRLRVTKEGIVVPEEKRISIDEVINLHEENSELKLSNSMESENQFVIIVDNIEEERNKNKSLKNPIEQNNEIKKENALMMSDVVSNLKSSAENPPPIPQNLKVERGGALTLDIHWDDVEGETGYILYRKKGSTGFSPIAYTGQNINWFTDQNINAGVLYKYMVCSKNSKGASAASAVAYNKGSQRTTGGSEKIKKLYVSTNFYNSIEGWPSGNLELDIRIVASKNGAIIKKTNAYFDNIDKDQQKGNWYFINNEALKWDLSLYGTVLTYLFIEDDGGDGLGDSFNMNVYYEDKLKPSETSELKIKYNAKYDKRDELIGEAIVCWWEKVSDTYYVINGSFEFETGHFFDDGTWNNTHKCPYVGTWDGAHCFVARPPGGSNPYIYYHKFYYIRNAGGNCINGFWKEGTTLCAKGIPTQLCEQGETHCGNGAFVYDGAFYVQPGY